MPLFGMRVLRIGLHVLALGWILVVAVVFVGCGTVRASGGIRQSDIGIANFHHYLSVSIVEAGPGIGNRLQFFSKVNEAVFINVQIVYRYYPDAGMAPGQGDVAVLQLDRVGTGRTQACQAIFPEIIEIRGVVEYRV